MRWAAEAELYLSPLGELPFRSHYLTVKIRFRAPKHYAAKSIFYAHM